jgi:hypothetical protein
MKLIKFILIASIVTIIVGCSSSATLSIEEQIQGDWKSESFKVKDYSAEDSGQAFLDGVMIAHLQMLFKSGASITFEQGKASFHGIPIEYSIENNDKIVLTSKGLGDMNLVLNVESKNDQLLLKHELGTAILIK